MRDAGLTHGAFYSHFSDKDELASAAFGRAITTGRPHWIKPMRGESWSARLSSLAKRYLSPAHRDDLSTSCGFSALSSDAAHASEQFRASYEHELRISLAAICDDDDLPTRPARRRHRADGPLRRRPFTVPRRRRPELVGANPEGRPRSRRRNSQTLNRIEEDRMAGAKPYGQLQYKEINGKRMAYIDEGEGRRDRLPARQPHVVVPVAQRDAAPGGAWPAGRLRPDRHGRLRQARRLRAGPLPLRRAARLPVRAVGRTSIWATG